jgi:hypothetical protein
MGNIMQRLFILLALLGITISAAMATEQTAGTAHPLITIRFNKPGVAYDRSLTTIVKQAQDIDPNTNYTLVIHTPQGLSHDAEAHQLHALRQHAQHIQKEMHALQVAPEHIHVEEAPTPGSVSTITIHAR